MNMVAAVSAFALATIPVTVTRDIHRAERVPEGWAVVVMHRYGDISVVGKDFDSLIVDGVIRATADNHEVAQLIADSMIDVTTTRRGETLLVFTRLPLDLKPTKDLSYEVHVRVTVPESSYVSASNAFGNLTVAGLHGGCRIDNRFGNVQLDRTTDCDVSGHHGDVRASRASGMLLVENSYGNVVLDEATDRVHVSNKYGDLDAQGVEGVVHLGNRFGRVVARPSGGYVTVVNQYGDVLTWVDDSALSELDVMAEMGRVELNLARHIPWQLGGRTMSGLIRSMMPIRVMQVSEQGAAQEVRGASGTGGTKIGLVGSWVDFLIQPSSAGDDTRDE